MRARNRTAPEIYVRFVCDATDSFGLLRATERWVARHYVYNNEKFRDDVDYTLGAVPPGRRRVTFLGDSFTAAHGVKDVRDRFANRVRAARPRWDVQVYEALYCGRGEAENRIREQQLGLFGTRLSTPTLQGNAVRMAMSAMAYVLTCALRRLGLTGTEMENAHADTIRLRLLRIGALVRITARKIWVSMSASWPWKESFEACARRLLAPAAVT